MHLLFFKYPSSLTLWLSCRYSYWFLYFSGYTFTRRRLNHYRTDDGLFTRRRLSHYRTDDGLLVPEPTSTTIKEPTSPSKVNKGNFEKVIQYPQERGIEKEGNTPKTRDTYSAFWMTWPDYEFNSLDSYETILLRVESIEDIHLWW